MTQALTNKPSELLFIVPATLANGQYQLVVRAKGKDSDLLKNGGLGSLVVVS